MMRQPSLVAAVLLMLATGCSGTPADSDNPAATGGSPPTRSGTAASAPPPTTGREPGKSPLPTRTASAGGRAAALRATTRCGPPGSQLSYADLTWTPARSHGTQRVAYTPYADGYRTGRYQTTTDLAPDAAAATLEQLSPGTTYTWLVLTRHGDRWDASAAAQFPAPICVADQGSGA